jgi:hypothetical protein
VVRVGVVAHCGACVWLDACEGSGANEIQVSACEAETLLGDDILDCLYNAFPMYATAGFLAGPPATSLLRVGVEVLPSCTMGLLLEE